MNHIKISAIADKPLQMQRAADDGVNHSKISAIGTLIFKKNQRPVPPIETLYLTDGIDIKVSASVTISILHAKHFQGDDRGQLHVQKSNARLPSWVFYSPYYMILCSLFYIVFVQRCSVVARE